jgi:hypothetical protein
VTVYIEGRAMLSLDPPSPNPSDRGLRVRFNLPQRGPGHLELVDLSGRRVNSIDVGARGPGVYEEDLAPGRRITAGVYIVRLTQGAETRVVRASVIR